MIVKMRRFFLISLIFFFLLTAPTVLFYAIGYNFDWQNKKVVMTGSIYLKSIPKKAEIHINDHLKNHTPRLLKRLVPKEYDIKVTKPNYHSWQKKLYVESRLVTEVRNIFLFPKNPEIELVDSFLPEGFSIESLFEEKDKEIFYIQKPSYILYKTNKDKTIQTQLSIDPLPKDHDYQIITSPNQNIAVIDDQGKLYFFNLEKKIFEKLADDIKKAQFSNDNKKLLYFSQNEIWVVYLEDVLIQPYKAAGEKELITRRAQEIKQAIWYPETNEHIIFTVDQFIKITELDSRDIRNTVDFIEISVSQINYDNKTGKLYFIKEEKIYRTSLNNS